MKKVIVAFVVALSSGVVPVPAAPARGGWFRHTQSDGSVITVKLVGDEFSHYFVAEDGCVMERLSNGDFVPLQSADHSSSLKQSAGRAVAARWRATARDYSPVAAPGKKKQLVVLMQYPDRQFLSPTPQSHWHNVLNTGNVEGFDIYGSMHKYFLDQSEGILDIDFDVYGPFTARHEMAYYGKNDGNGNDQHAEELVIEACKAVEGQANLSDYDWDGDGEVEQMVVIYAGNGENDGAATDRDKTIWPHQYYLSAYKPYEPYKYGDNVVDKYIVINDEFRGKTDGFGTVVHEFSHCLGLPDFYQTGGTEHGKDNFGYYDIMHSGCYNNNSWCPVGYTAYEKEYLGWLTTEELTAPTSISGLNSVANGGKAYKIRNNAASASVDEYYLLENRRKEGWDAYIPGEGLVITHYDYDPNSWYFNSVNNVGTHQRAVIIPACNNNRNVAGYPYPYSETTPYGETIVNDCLTDDSAPAATVFNKTGGDNSNFMGKPVTNISKDSDGLVSFDFMGGTSAIGDIPYFGDEADLEYFDLMGRKVFSPTNGIYIIRNKKTNKTYKSIYK